MGEVWTTISPEMLGTVLDEHDPERRELARRLLVLPCLPLRQASTETRVRVRCRSPGVRRWRDWGESIAARGFSEEPIGRFARSLRRLPRPYWRLPLRELITASLGDTRRRPWLGPAKLMTLGEILRDLAATLDAVPEAATPEVRVRVTRFDEVERMGMDSLDLASWRGVRVVRQALLPLLLDQIEEDIGIRGRQLFAHRLLPSPMAVTQAEHAARLNMTRSRLYQLLREGRVALRLRWPEGPWILRSWAFLASQRPDGEPWERLLRQVASDLFGEPESGEK